MVICTKFVTDNDNIIVMRARVCALRVRTLPAEKQWMQENSRRHQKYV